MPKVSKKLSTKDAGVPKTKRVEEIIKCGSDPTYFLNNYAKISHAGKGLIPFQTFNFQEKCLEAFQKNRYVIINKSRQLGISTITAGYVLWLCLFQREKNVLVVATKLETAKIFMTRVRTIYQSLPSWLVIPTLTTSTVKEMGWSNGSRVKAVPTSEDAGRGESLSLLVMDEAAHIEGIDELWLAVYSGFSSTGGSAIMLSSPSGVGTLFHKLWVDAQAGINDFVPIELPWNVHPERDQEWFEKERRQLLAARGESGVAQELLCSFQASGDTFLKGKHLEQIMLSTKEPIQQFAPSTDFPKKDVWVWKYPLAGHNYIIAADVCRGDGDDFSAAHVIDTNENEVVCEYKGKIPPDKFGEFLSRLGIQYNTALVCVEKNSIGYATALKLKELKYPNLYYEYMSKQTPGQQYRQQFKSPDELAALVPGFETTAKSRVVILAQLEEALRNEKLKVYSQRLYKELQTFIWKNNKLTALKGYNDDLIMSLAIAVSLYDVNGSTGTYSEDEFAKGLLAGMSVSSNTLNDQPVIPKQGESQQYYPPVVTSNKFMDQAKQFKGRSGTQDMGDPFWREFKWVMED